MTLPQIPTYTKVLATRPLDPLTKLNLGCGNDIHLDMINLDINEYPGVDIVHDISEPWPFLLNRFEEIHANHILEHVPDLIFTINEAWRVMKPNGRLLIAVPWWSGTWARGDPTHCRQFDHNSFAYFSDWHARNKYLGIRGPWKKLSQDYTHEPPDADRTFLQKFGFSDILQMRVVLQKPKE